MYDIEDDKVRRYVAKYLERKGCVRIQKSVFLAEAHRKIYQEIGETLKEVNEIYTNRDSIYLVPVSSDEIKATRIIGEGFDANLFTDPPGTLIV
ncbi:MAG: CRISPR-associated endonuclease Cas2 [Bacteroidota bacterium]